MIKPEFDIENRLKIYFPILFELLDGNKINWKKAKKVFTRKFQEYEARQAATNSGFRIEASFYNIISSAINKEPGAIRLLDFIQKLFEELTDGLNRPEKKLIKDNVFGFLTNMDMKYLNFLGELCVLNHLKRVSPYKLIDTEVLLIPEKKDGSKIDFKFLNTETKKDVLVEIVNIHLNEKNTADEVSIENMLTQKIGEKLLKKGITQNKGFNLIPVLWGQWTEIKVIGKYYEAKKTKFANTTTPVCFMTFTDQNGVMVHKFGTIDTIFENTTKAN